MSAEQDDKVVQAILKEKDSAGAFSSLIAYWITHKLESGIPLSEDSIRELFVSTAMKLGAFPTPRDEIDIRDIYNSLANHATEFAPLKGDQLCTYIFRLIDWH